MGLNTALLSPSGGNLGIGFAVPSNMVRDVMDQIIRTGKVTRGYLGVSIQDVTPDLATAMKLKDRHGALIGEVDPKGPAVGPLPLRPADDQLSHSLELEPLPAGCYRLDIAAIGESAGTVQPVHGLFLVADDTEPD